MNEQEIKDGNKLIAGFMGGIVQEDGTCNPYPNNLPHWAGVLYNFDTMKVGGYKYHESFDWLMPVLEKIEKDYHTMIHDKKCTISNADRVFEARGVRKIGAVWKAVLDFIQWYNSQNNKS